MQKYLVLSGNSQVGAAAARQLLASGANVRIGVRDTRKAGPLADAGAEVVAADLDRPESLPAALAGVTGVLLSTAVDPAIHLLHERLYSAARTAGVNHIVRISAVGAAVEAPIQLGRTHGMADAALQESGIGWTILLPHSFTQNLLSTSPMVSKGQIFGTSGTGRVPYVDARDIGAAGAAALTKDGHRGQTYLLTGPESLSMDEVAATFTEVLKRKVEYVDIPAEAYQAGMLAAGLPAWLAADLTWIAVNLHTNGLASRVSNSVELLTGSKPRTVRQFIEEHRSRF